MSTGPVAPAKTGVCRTCLESIVHETRTETGYLPRTAWFDDAPRDAGVCFKAINYTHVPLEGRELAYYKEGAGDARAEVARRLEGLIRAHQGEPVEAILCKELSTVVESKKNIPVKVTR